MAVYIIDPEHLKIDWADMMNYTGTLLDGISMSVTFVTHIIFI